MDQPKPEARPHKAASIRRGIIGGAWPPSAVGELSFAREGKILVRPWHGFEYDLNTGRELFWPRGASLRLCGATPPQPG